MIILATKSFSDKSIILNWILSKDWFFHKARLKDTCNIMKPCSQSLLASLWPSHRMIFLLMLVYKGFVLQFVVSVSWSSDWLSVVLAFSAWLIQRLFLLLHQFCQDIFQNFLLLFSSFWINSLCFSTFLILSVNSFSSFAYFSFKIFISVSRNLNFMSC